ncbi:hypothetical protein PHLCEN_2v2197 [Hermanssonia centrifuga]|uniref:Major facilitator superfamily MFS-1 n=1 Tax=Hermanssonia centrifuga TaxID=98765 RepID=A0A2R6RPU8_9APHY|nr:hypothetical protein PHLCEN_2v2197 [Hermanssonia centrifuga]
MSDPSSNRTAVPLGRNYTDEESALDADETSPSHIPASSQPTQTRRPSGPGRVSFSKPLGRKPSLINRLRDGWDEEAARSQSPKSERPAIPSALQPSPEVYSTPLPTLSMTVLSITMLGEFLSANVSAPFLLFMVESFHQFDNEADVGYWTGILVSTFFLTQFLTSLLWATVAAKHGSRLVIGISLFGSAITCVMFGTSKSIQQAMAIRLMQGVFAGAIGVARGAVTGVTDQSNEGRAYAILGFCWGFGGVAGAIVGGTFENPAKKWPGVFNTVPLFVEYPYLLPAIVASVVTFIESPPISPIEEEHEPQGIVGSFTRKVGRKFSGLFASRVPDDPMSASESTPVLLSAPQARNRSDSRTNRFGGSAYGYNGTFRSRLASHGTIAPSISARRGSTAAMSYRRRRESNANTITGEPPMSSSYATAPDLNFAQRLLMANENTVTNIADLWVASAMNVDNEDPFESEDEEWLNEPEDNEDALIATPGDGPEEAAVFAADATPRNNRFIRRQSVGSPSVHQGALRSPHGPSTSQQRDYFGSRRFSSALSTSASGYDHGSPTPGGRRFSTAAPSIFSHVGVRTPPAVIEAQQLLALADEAEAGAASDSLAPIMEGRQASHAESADVQLMAEPSLWSQLPLLIIFQYGLLALHSTTHDQIFYLYLVS